MRNNTGTQEKDEQGCGQDSHAPSLRPCCCHSYCFHRCIKHYEPVTDVPLYSSDRINAERQVSGAPESRSEARAEAGGRRLQTLIRPCQALQLDQSTWISSSAWSRHTASPRCDRR